MNKLPQEFKEKWVGGLRSGKFKQGKGYLYNNFNLEDTYCCLGVACVVCGIPKDEIASIAVPESDYNGKLPKELTPDIDGEDAIFDKEVDKLISMNDGLEPYAGKSLSFDEIADYIEENL